MASDYQISVGVKADFSQLKDQSQEGAASLESFQTRSARAVLEFQAAAAEGAAAADFLNKQMKDLGVAGIAVVPAMEQATAALRASQAAEEADAIAAKAAAAAKRELSTQTNLAGQSMRVFEGSAMGSARAAGMFATQTLGLGPIVAAAFPVIGALALGEVLFQVGKAIAKFATDATDLSRELNIGWLDGAIGQMTGLAAATKQADAEALHLAADQDSLRNQSQQADIEHIRLTQGAAAADYAKAGNLQDRINAIEQLKSVQLAAIDEARKRAESADTLDREGSQGVTRARVEQAAATAQYNDLLAQEVVLIKQKENLYLEAEQAQKTKQKEGGNPAGTQMRADETALADQKRAHGMSVEEEIAFWQKRLSAYRHGSAQYLQIENRINELSAQAQKEQAQTRSQFVEESIQQDRQKQQESEHVTQEITAAHEADLSRRASDAEAAAVSAQAQIEAAAKVGTARIQYQEATGVISKHAAALQLGALHAKEYADRITNLTQELEALRQVEAMGGNTGAQQATVQNQITGLHGSAQASSYSDMGAGAKKDASAWQQTWNDTFQNVTGSFSQTMATWLVVSDGYNTQFSVLMGRMMVSVVEQFAQSIIQMGVQWAAHEAQTLLLHMATEDAKTTITVTGNTIQTTSTISANAIKQASDATTATMSISKKAADAAAGAWNALSNIPVVGPVLGAAAAAATWAGVMALAAFENGADYIPRTGVAMLHQGEAVATAGENSRISQVISMAAGGAGGDVHYHSNANFTGIDGASVAGMYRSNAAAGRREFARQMRLMNKI